VEKVSILPAQSIRGKIKAAPPGGNYDENYAISLFSNSCKLCTQ